MAGNYMDAPAPRISYDRDGSLFVGVNIDGTITTYTTNQARAMNAEDGAGMVGTTTLKSIVVVFPIPVDISYVFFAWSSTTTVSVLTSTDTTNGLDGTWTTHVSGWNSYQPVAPNYRMASQGKSTIPGTSSTAVRAVKIQCDGSAFSSYVLRALHLYGSPSATATTDRLAIWHPTSDIVIPATWFDWGNVPRGTTADQTFRIKNLSATLTANQIGVYMDALTPGSPSVAGMHTLSDTGTSFGTGFTVPSLAPGAISPVYTLRRVVPTNAQVSVWSARLVADVSSWSA